MQHYIQKLLPKSFDNMWLTNAEHRLVNNVIPMHHQLRNEGQFFIPPSRLNLTDRFPLVCIPKLWQSLEDENIKIQRNKNIFNSLLRKHYLNQLQADFKCDRLLCPHCLTI